MSESTVIGKGIKVQGEISGAPAIEVLGTIEGTARSESSVHVRPGGKVAGAIAGEDTPGTVPAVCCGREADNEQARVRVAEAREGLRPVLPIAVRGALFARRLLAPLHQTRAQCARDHLRIDERE